MRKMTENELLVLSTVVQAEIADMNANNQVRTVQGLSPAYDYYSSENYDLLCEQLELIKQEGQPEPVPVQINGVDYIPWTTNISVGLANAIYANFSKDRHATEYSKKNDRYSHINLDLKNAPEDKVKSVLKTLIIKRLIVPKRLRRMGDKRVQELYKWLMMVQQ